MSCQSTKQREGVCLSNWGWIISYRPPISTSHAWHRAHAQMQRSALTFLIDGLEIEAPAGVYHPTPEFSSLLFIRYPGFSAVSPGFRACLKLGWTLARSRYLSRVVGEAMLWRTDL